MALHLQLQARKGELVVANLYPRLDVTLSGPR